MKSSASCQTTGALCRNMGRNMPKSSFVLKSGLSLVLPLLLLMLSSSCSTFTGGDNTDPSTPPPPDYIYYEFPDVPIPRDLSRDESDSFIVDSPPLKSGVMVFSGTYDRPTLLDFFMAAMPNNGWTMRSVFKASRSLLIYTKSNRYCVISLTPSYFIKTRVEIWMTTVDSTGTAPIPPMYDYGNTSSSFID